MQKADGDSISMVGGRSQSFDALDARIASLVKEAGVAGLSLAILQPGGKTLRLAYGKADCQRDVPMDERTLLAGASLSKPVFAYLATRLAAQTVFKLDVPLQDQVDLPLADLVGRDAVDIKGPWGDVTAEHVLSHTSGLPNLRAIMPNGKLGFLFPPGERFSYSSEGYVLLQRVLERLSGEGLEVLASREVFKPLSMNSSSYVRPACSPGLSAVPHGVRGNPLRITQEVLMGSAEPRAGGSLWTTPSDYGRFLSALGPSDSSSVAPSEMRAPWVSISSENMFGPGAAKGGETGNGIGLAWTLGLGMFRTPYGRAYFHTGHAFGWQNYAVVFVDYGVGVVLMSNSDRFESAAPEILRATVGDEYSPTPWLGFGRPIEDAADCGEPDGGVKKASVGDAAPYAGRYRNAGNRTVFVGTDPEGVTIGSGNRVWGYLDREASDAFRARGEELQIAFGRTPKGEVDRLEARVQGTTLRTLPRIEGTSFRDECC